MNGRDSTTLDRIVAIARRDVFILRTYRFYLISRIAAFLLLVVILFYVSRLVGPEASLREYGGRYFDYAIVGVVMARIVELGLGAFPQAISDEQKIGSLEMVLATPTPLPTLLAGALVVPLGMLIVECAVILTLGTILLDAGLDPRGVPLALLVLPLTLAVICSAGIGSAAFIVLTKRGDPFTLIGRVATTLLAGAFFPVSLLPGPVAALAKAFPPFYALEALRAVLLGNGGLRDITGELAVLAVFSLVAVPASLWLFARCLRIARVTGTLATY